MAKKKAIKASAQMEAIFAHGVALEQSGRMKNTIYVIDREVFILNTDRTIVLGFQLPKLAPKFESPVSFKASDYGSSLFHEEDGLIKFITSGKGYTKTKTCKTPEFTPKEARALHKKFTLKKSNTVTLSKGAVDLLDTSLSHIEFSGNSKKGFKIIQRNIYDGTTLEIEREQAKGFGVSSPDKIAGKFGPLGMRTNDFVALFSFNDEITFEFPATSKKGFATFSGRNLGMSGVVALCLYDELGEIRGAEGTPDDPPLKKKKAKKDK